MSDTLTLPEAETDATPRTRRSAGGREAKRAARSARVAQSAPYITRKIPYFEVLDEEGLATIERNANTILEEIGIDFRDDAEALDIWRKAGAEITGERVRFPGGMCRAIVQAKGNETLLAGDPVIIVTSGNKMRVTRAPR